MYVYLYVGDILAVFEKASQYFMAETSDVEGSADLTTDVTSVTWLRNELVGKVLRVL